MMVPPISIMALSCKPKSNRLRVYLNLGSRDVAATVYPLSRNWATTSTDLTDGDIVEVSAYLESIMDDLRMFLKGDV